jgi:hypothetical protein
MEENEKINKPPTAPETAKKEKCSVWCKRLPTAAFALGIIAPFWVLAFGITGILDVYGGFGWGPLGAMLVMFTFLAPIAGVILAVVSLCYGKKRIGTRGFIYSIIAIALPAACLIIFIVFLSLFAASALVFGM